MDYRKIKPKPDIRPSNTKLVGYPSTEIPTLGRCILKVEARGKVYPLTFMVVPGDAPALLGKDACVKLDLIQRNEINAISAETQYLFDHVLDDYPDLFDGIGTLPGKVHIKLRPDAEPVVETCRRVPFTL